MRAAKQGGARLAIAVEPPQGEAPWDEAQRAIDAFDDELEGTAAGGSYAAILVGELAKERLQPKATRMHVEGKIQLRVVRGASHRGIVEDEALASRAAEAVRAVTQAMSDRRCRPARHREGE